MVVCPALYFPPIYFYSCWKNYSILIIEQQETYQKRSLRNKCRILGPNGVMILSVPLKKGKHQSQLIRDVEISYSEDWIKLHLRTLQSCYGNSPFFDYYFESIQNTLNQRFTHLFDLNITILKWSVNCLQLKHAYEFTQEFKKRYTDEIFDLRPYFGQNSAKLENDKKATNKYVQVFEEHTGFIPNLSILDLLFCTGPEAITYL